MGETKRWIPRTAGERYRLARFALCRSLIEGVLAERGRCAIIDVGGLLPYWTLCAPDLLADPRVAFDLVNLSHGEEDHRLAEGSAGRIRLLTGNATRLDGIASGTYDIAHSNSVIEHVGRWQDMMAMAREMRRIARVHYLQTPYWGFPIEPHFRAPFLHWLPEQWRARLMLRFHLNVGARPADLSEAMTVVQSAALLDRAQLAALFPTSNIHSEIVRGLTKSLIVVGGEGVAMDPRSNTRRLRTQPA